MCPGIEKNNRSTDKPYLFKTMFWNLLLSIGKLKYEHIELQSYLKGEI